MSDGPLVYSGLFIQPLFEFVVFPLERSLRKITDIVAPGYVGSIAFSLSRLSE